MCLITIALQQSPQYPIILLANRDEFYNRKASAMHWWKDEAILAGKDLQGGGTWLAINTDKHFASVTNYRDPKSMRTDAPSRGSIPIDVLKYASSNFERFVQSQQSEWSKMNGFNLIYHNGKDTYYYSNISKEIKKLESGLYGLSNAFLDTPWPKVIQIKSSLQSLIDDKKLNTEDFLKILENPTQFPIEKLPHTGVGLEMEKILSPICIHSPIYGTRVHSIITLNAQNQMSVIEKDTLSNTIVQFQIP
ncbi:MAG: NRDE family protein [Chitinophagales bacterium]|nr:NRDE family protein [Chitinophagales bacterium]